MAEYLKLKGVQNWGAEAFSKISSNITKDERGLKLDAGVQDVQYTEHLLLEQLETCAEYIDKSERYEVLGKLYHKSFIFNPIALLFFFFFFSR